MSTQQSTAETIAKKFHETYERLAPEHDYKTREKSAVPWEDVPANNKSLMISVVQELLDNGTITAVNTNEVVARLRVLAAGKPRSAVAGLIELFTAFVRKVDPWALDPSKGKALSAMLRTLRDKADSVTSEDPKTTEAIKLIRRATRRYDSAHASLYEAMMFGNRLLRLAVRLQTIAM